MIIQVLGPGCKRCDQLYENALAAAARFTVPGESLVVEKVKDLDALYRLGVFVTPGLVIDGQVISSGKLLDPGQIEAEILKRLNI